MMGCGRWQIRLHSRKEVHLADELVKHHSSVVLIISAALLAYESSKYLNENELLPIGKIGFLVSIEWLLEINVIMIFLILVS